MKIKLLYLMLFVLVLIIAACSNEVNSDLKKYKRDMKPIYKKEDTILDNINQLNLDKLDQLVGTEVTAEKHKELNKLHKELDKEVLPEVKSLKKQAENIEPSTQEVKDAHNIYVSNVKKREDSISELNEYISLFEKSIRSNEKILEYTEVFEKNKAVAEKNASKAKDSSEDKDDYEALVSVIDKNSDDLNNKAKYLNEAHSVKEKSQYIHDKIIPSISKYVKALNQTNIKSNRVNQMRQSQIEMYYTLSDYYKERKRGIIIEEKLQKIKAPDDFNSKVAYLGKDEKYDKAIDRLEK